LKESSNRFILFLFVADIFFSELALFLAEITRGVMPFGRESVGMSFLDLSIMLAVAILW